MVEVVNQEEITDLQNMIENNMADYIDEWVMDKVEKLIEETLDGISENYESLIYETKEHLIYEMYKMKSEIQGEIQKHLSTPKKSFWKWW
jgi:AraC-like DNA-binding protein